MALTRTRFGQAALTALLFLVMVGTAWGGSWSESLSSGWNSLTGWFGGSDEPPAQPADPDDSLPGYLAEGWGKLTDTLSEALTLRDKQETLPSSSWLGPDKRSNARRINALLDQALDILVQGEAGEMRRRSRELRDEIPALRLEADKLRNQRITAPESSAMPWATTRKKIDARIEELNRSIQEKEASLEAINEQLAEALREMGVQLDQAQVDVLLSSVTGDDLLQNAVVFSNVRAVVEKLETLSRSDRTDLEISRRYTGMYLVLNDLLIHTQEELVRKIDGDYRPRLNEIAGEAEALAGEARKRSAQNAYSREQRESFARNAESNALTVRVAKLYADLLDSQRRGALDSLQDLKRNRDLAENTYRTVRSSGDLRTLIHSGLALFDSIHALSMPKLQPFENEAIRREFEKINRRLKR